MLCTWPIFHDLTSVRHVLSLRSHRRKLSKIEKKIIVITFIVRRPQLRSVQYFFATSTLFYLRLSLTESEEKEAESEFTVHLP